MRNYQTEFKLKVVKSFLDGDGGANLLARQWSVPVEKIRTWVSHYRLHGIDGLRPKRSKYSAQLKLQVLSHQDREQLSSRQVAAVYDIRNPNQVVTWRRKLDEGGVEAFGIWEQEHSSMKNEQHSLVPPSSAITDSAQVAYLKNCKP
jgi:transposase